MEQTTSGSFKFPTTSRFCRFHWVPWLFPYGSHKPTTRSGAWTTASTTSRRRSSPSWPPRARLPWQRSDGRERPRLEHGDMFQELDDANPRGHRHLEKNGLDPKVGPKTLSCWNSTQNVKRWCMCQYCQHPSKRMLHETVLKSKTGTNENLAVTSKCCRMYCCFGRSSVTGPPLPKLQKMAVV